MKVNVPPLKSQGIKTKLVPWIGSIIPHEFEGKWIEPFMGTGVVAFNLAREKAFLCDVNPHLVRFYQAIAEGEITPEIVKNFLEKEGVNLLTKGELHYYELRDRFNNEHSPLDFLFLNRSCFNGIIRFNRKQKYIKSLWGDFNILTREHFYHVGGSEKNRGKMVEAVITNYDTLIDNCPEPNTQEQLVLLESKFDGKYGK